MLPEQKIEKALGRRLKRIDRLTAQSSWVVYRAWLEDEIVCIKYGENPPPFMLTYEATGLRKIAEMEILPVPAVWYADDQLLITTWIDQSHENALSWEQFGERLARHHAQHHDMFGFDMDGYCGLGGQENHWQADGYVFFAQHRLEPQARRARDNGLISSSEAVRISQIANNLPGLIPEQPPSLLHGDLWRGNVLLSSDNAFVIDPAAHYGWAEADLAMTCLFGGFPPGFYRSYESNQSLQPGFSERLDVYNLYHLLNHLNIFGPGWHGRVMEVVNRFS